MRTVEGIGRPRTRDDAGRARAAGGPSERTNDRRRKERSWDVVGSTSTDADGDGGWGGMEGDVVDERDDTEASIGETGEEGGTGREG